MHEKFASQLRFGVGICFCLDILMKAVLFFLWLLLHFGPQLAFTYKNKELKESKWKLGFVPRKIGGKSQKKKKNHLWFQSSWVLEAILLMQEKIRKPVRNLISILCKSFCVARFDQISKCRWNYRL